MLARVMRREDGAFPSIPAKIAQLNLITGRHQTKSNKETVYNVIGLNTSRSVKVMKDKV